jgi:glycosyltransferase involved in cell wall biosynthesis
MKVGLVGTPPALRDADASTGDGSAALASALASRGLDVTVFGCRSDSGGPDVVDLEAGYRVVYMPEPAGVGPTEDLSDADLAPAMGDFARFLADRWATDPPDVVNAGTWIYGIAAQLAADRHGIPSVQTLPELGDVVHRRQGREVGPPTRARFERLLARSATRVFASCTEDVIDLVRIGCPRGRLSVLPQAVDTDLFSPAGPAEHRASERRIVGVARDLLPHRGFDDLIRAMPRLPDTELVIVGGPPHYALDWDPHACRLRSLAIELGVANRVRMTGWVAADRVLQILRSSDVFAAPSWYEPFGLPVVEAMACGLPVVATEAGGMLDTIVHDVTGVHVPARDPVTLGKALGEVLHGGPLRSGMGLAGRVRARSRYSWDRVAAEAETVYERALAHPKVRGDRNDVLLQARPKEAVAQRRCRSANRQADPTGSVTG